MFIISIVALILILIGGLNWGFVGFFNYNFISAIFGGNVAGDYTGFERFIYAVVGLAAIWGLSFLGRAGKLCPCGSKSKGEKCCSNKEKE